MSNNHFGSVLMGHKLATTVPVQLAVDLSALAIVVVLLLITRPSDPVIWVGLPAVLLVITAVRSLIVARRARTAADQQDPR